MRTHTKQDSFGFTLIEMMVSVSIFSMVMLVSTGALLSIIDNNRKAQSQESAFTNLNFALESMSRAIRVGSFYHCDYTQGLLTSPRDCSGGSTSFAFEAFGGSSGNPNDQVIYRLRGTQIERSVDGGSNYVPVTAPEVVVQGLTFYVRGSTSGDTRQPFVLISTYGYAGTSTKSRVYFNLQTAVTERLLDI